VAADSGLALLLLVWMAVGIVILRHQWRRNTVGAGLVIAYLLNLALIHWVAPLVYLLPWYSNYDVSVVKAGFTQATYGVVAFTVGVLVLGPFLMRLYRFPPPPGPPRQPNPRLAKAYIATGFLTYFVLMPLLRGLPTVTALLSAAWSLAAVGFALACWWAWGARRRILGWVTAAMSLPFITTVFQGFLGYGAVTLLTVFAFLASFVRPRWKVLVGGAVVSYLGLSLYVTYMGARSELREVVWGGASLPVRVEQVVRMVRQMEWFDPYNGEHLRRIDGRLNQNFLVGSAVYYLESGLASYARGETIWQALLSVVPRVFWPEKPVFAGSPGLVSRYTGIVFAPGTSVGIGQVMEFYINFGTVGVIAGFLVFGAILAALDRAAAERLYRGDWQGFALWFLPGLALLQVGGSLVEVTASAGAAMVTAYLVNKHVLPRLRGREVSAARLGAPEVR
jgi:hypothetical protein